MTDFYHYKIRDFKSNSLTTTIASGPVIINNKKEFLLHRAKSTGKFQFSGGRVDDNLSFKENAVFRPFEDLGIEIELFDNDPFVIIDEIKRDGVKEILTLIHYLGKLKKNSLPVKGEWSWVSLEEIQEMNKIGELSSPNIILACEHFN